MLRIVCVLACALLAAACSVVGSSLIDEGFSGRCESDAGSYYLPKTHIQVEITEQTVNSADGNEASQAAGMINGALWHDIAVKNFRLPDRQRGYCLDYLWRGSSDDKVYVKKYKASPLLGVVSSDVIDRSLEIAQALIQTIFVSASGNPDYQLSSNLRDFAVLDEGGKITKRIAFKADYDPFDPARTAGINQALSRMGYCLILEEYTFDLARATINEYCDKPVATHKRAGQKKLEYVFGPGVKDAAQSAHAGEDPTINTRGLFYRARIAYQFSIFTKRNLQAAGGWKLVASHPVGMENIAPIMSVGLDRTMFAERKTTLVFDEGMLKEACHFKGSEFEAAAKIPLVISQSVVAFPANFVSVRIDQTNGMKELINAQNNAIKAQTAYLADLNKLTTEAKGENPGASKIAKSVGGLQLDENKKYKDFDPTYTTSSYDDDKVWPGEADKEPCRNQNEIGNEGRNVIDITATVQAP